MPQEEVASKILPGLPILLINIMLMLAAVVIVVLGIRTMEMASMISPFRIDIRRMMR